MPVNYVIRRGDSLYALAARYLGNPNRWNEIYSYHNEQVKQRGPANKALVAIKDPNVIYVGQVLVIPGRGQQPKMKIANPVGVGIGIQKTAAIPIDLKVEYQIGRDTPPISYVEVNNEYEILIEMTGKISIEIVSIDRYQHNYDLLMCGNSQQAKAKLSEKYNPVVSALLAKPKMVFEKGTLTVYSPIAANANIAPFEIKVGNAAPNCQSGILGPVEAHGVFQRDRIEYKYGAEITYKTEVRKKNSTRPGVDQSGIDAAFKGAVFGFKASGVVIRETTKIVAMDVALALTNYIPLSEGISFWFGRGVSGWVIHNNFIGANQTAVRISLEIQSIHHETFKTAE